MTRITRAVLAAALVSAAVLPTAASAQGPRCRVVWDPRAVWTPVGVVQVPYPYVYCS